MEVIATIFFGLAIVHSFLGPKIVELIGGGAAAHLLGEMEFAFGWWALCFLAYFGIAQGSQDLVRYVSLLHFTEAFFVFVVMIICATKPILAFASFLLQKVSRLIPLAPAASFYFTTLSIGPLLGSLITEPAAMTVCALILRDQFFSSQVSMRFKYATIGLLFVNISVGGVLTPYAAPPVLMVAKTFGWDLAFMLNNFAWRAIAAILLSTTLMTFMLRRELEVIPPPASNAKIQTGITLAHFAFLAIVVKFVSSPAIFLASFLVFALFYSFTKKHQTPLHLKSAALVATFLAGLVVLGTPQAWWLEPLLTSLSVGTIYLAAVGLTAFVDNAALTYLGAQVPGLTQASQYYLVAGAVVGGGLTVLANAPNPVGKGILQPSLGESLSALGLLKAAIVPTLIALILFGV